MPNHKSNDYKDTAVQYYLVEDKSQEEVCQIFHCSPRSLMRWVKRYHQNGNTNNEYRKPIAYKIKKEHIHFILNEIKNNKTITIDDLLFILKNKYPDLHLSQSHLHRVVRDNNITLKLTRVRHEPNKRFGKDIDINNNLTDFYNEIKKWNIDDIICIDETSIKSLQKRNHCYSDIGKRCVIKTQSQEVFKKYTGIFAISVNGELGWDLYEKSGINTDRLEIFLDKFVTGQYKKKLVILDNASSHRNERIKTVVNKENTILYAVPYQHFTNSIENYFSMLKSRLQKLEGLRYEDLKRNISKVITEIPKEKYENIFKGAYVREKVYTQRNKTRKLRKKNYL